MERTLVGNPHRSAKLLGLLGGDIMGDFLIRRLLTTAVPAESREILEGVLSDEVRHIRFLRSLLVTELAGLEFRKERWSEASALAARASTRRHRSPGAIRRSTPRARGHLRAGRTEGVAPPMAAAPVDGVHRRNSAQR